MFKYLQFILVVITCKGISAQCALTATTIENYNCATNCLVYNTIISSTCGTAPYSFTFSPNVPNNTVGGVNTATVCNPGTYNVFFKDALNNTGFTQYIVSPANFTMQVGIVFLANPLTKSITCFGANDGQITSTLTGLAVTPPSTYTWSTASNSNSITNLGVGTYTVRATDAAGCTATATYNMVQPNEINSTTIASLTCYGSSTTALITSTGGIAPYTYSVNGIGISGNTITNLTAGTHTIITKDANNCLKTNIVTVIGPPAPSFNFNVVQPSCPTSSNGALSVVVTNMAPINSYTWNSPTNFNVSLSNIPPGVYTVTVKDLIGCTATNTFQVLPLSNIQAAIVTKPENCSATDGGATITVTGATPPVSYSLNTLPTQTSNIFTGLSTGVQSLVVFQANTCSLVTTFSVGNTSSVQVSVSSQTDILCYNQCDGKVVLNVTNAVPPVSFSLTNLPTYTTNNITNVCAGTYTIKAVDNIGCYAITTVTFTNPAPYTFSITGTSLICIGNAANLTSTLVGGTAPYTYSWMPGGFTTSNVSVSPTTTTTYSLNIFDSKGCGQIPTVFTVNVNPPLSVSVSAQNTGICPGTTAQITPSVSGGNGVYNYLWLPGNFTTPSIFISNLTNPVYTVIVSDGCGTPAFTKIIPLQIFPVTVPTFSANVVQGCQPLCVQFKNTTPTASNHYWNFGDTPFEQFGENPYYCYDRSGQFNVKLYLTDSNGCKVNSTVSNYINVFPQPKPDFITKPDVLNDNLSEGELICTTANANSYSWFVDGVYYGNNKNITINFNDTSCFIIKLTTANNNGCIDSLFRRICIKPGFNFYIPNAFTPNGDGLNDVFMPSGTAWLFENYTFKVNNRLGRVMFKTNSISDAWDGKYKGSLVPNDTYLWIIQVRDFYGNDHEFKGYVDLLR